MKTTASNSHWSPAIINVVVFISLLCAGGILSLILEKLKVSQSEKRELTPMPKFSRENLFMGGFTDSLDLHYSDTFPFRDGFVEFSQGVKEIFGYRANDTRIYLTNPVEAIHEDKTDTIAVIRQDSVVLPEKQPAARNTRELASSILIHDGRAFQLFRGNDERAAAFAETINLYRKVLPDSIKIYCLVAPSSIDFYLPPSLKTDRNLEKPNIKVVYEHLDSGVYGVDAYGEIERHQGEYLYFKTDHHWTVRGAYCAYRAFCTSAGLVPAELSSMRRRVRKGYLGSLYDITKDVRLKNSKDSVESFVIPVETTCYRYRTADLIDPVIAPLIAGSPNYATFLGGDFPLVRIDTENPGSRKILVIKDSFGNALCPFLAMNFSEVFVVDYRYFERNLPAFIQKNAITDVIFLHNTFVVNTEFTVKKEKYLMKKKDPQVPQEISIDQKLPGESIDKKDSIEKIK